MIKETLEVRGMHCPKCTARVEKAVGTLDGVESVLANFEEDRVDLCFDGAQNTREAIKAAIENEGFEVVG